MSDPERSSQKRNHISNGIYYAIVEANYDNFQTRLQTKKQLELNLKSLGKIIEGSRASKEQKDQLLGVLTIMSDLIRDGCDKTAANYMAINNALAKGDA
jgi:hypothetical protein